MYVATADLKFLGMSFVAPVACGFLLVSAIIVQIGEALGDTIHIVWIAGGWSIASSVSFAMAGGLSLGVATLYLLAKFSQLLEL
jgi:hypothetical protein